VIRAVRRLGERNGGTLPKLLLLYDLLVRHLEALAPRIRAIELVDPSGPFDIQLRRRKLTLLAHF